MERSIPIKKRRRYFRRVYERNDVLDTARLVHGPGKLRIYDAIQSLAKIHGGPQWPENRFSSFWPFGLTQVIGAETGRPRWEWNHSFVDAYSHDFEEDTGFVRPDLVEAASQAHKVFAQVKKELTAAIMDGTLLLSGESLHDEFNAGDFKKDVVLRNRQIIFETGAVSCDELIDVSRINREREGIIYLYVPADSFAAYIERLHPKAEEKVPNEVPDESQEKRAKSKRGPKPIKLESVIDALKGWYGEEYPSVPPKKLLQMVNEKLEKESKEQVSLQTVYDALKALRKQQMAAIAEKRAGDHVGALAP